MCVDYKFHDTGVTAYKNMLIIFIQKFYERYKTYRVLIMLHIANVV